MPEHAATQPTRVELLRERAFAAVGFISTVVVLGQTLWDPVVREVARLLGAKGGLWPFVFGSVFWPCLVLFLAAIITTLAVVAGPASPARACLLYTSDAADE